MWRPLGRPIAAASKDCRDGKGGGINRHTRLNPSTLASRPGLSYMSCKGTHDDFRETTEALRSGRTAMRKLVIAAAFSAAFMSGAQALEQGGTVLSVDEASKTFTCHWGVMDKTYKTTEKTVIRVGQQGFAECPLCLQ
jgi:hypothetical protein